MTIGQYFLGRQKKVDASISVATDDLATAFVIYMHGFNRLRLTNADANIPIWKWLILMMVCHSLHIKLWKTASQFTIE